MFAFSHQQRASGQAMISAVLFFLIGTMIVLGAIVAPVLRDTRGAANLGFSKVAYASAEGALEDTLYRHIAAKPVSNPEVFALGDASLTVSSQDIAGEKIVTAVSNFDDRIRKVTLTLLVGSGASFNFGLQADAGGIVMENSSSVLGNVYSNGNIVGANSNIVYGDIISAGPSGLIDGAHATGSAYAHTIRNSDIDKDAYYQVISGTTVGGTSYPGSADQPTTTLPIPDSLVETWKSEALAGGVHTSPCPYQVAAGSVTLGPKKIACDMEFTNVTTLNLTGPVWVEGNLSFKNSVTVNVDPTVGNKSVSIVVDKPADRLTSSKVILENSTQFNGSGGDRSYVLVLSQNRSAETGGSEVAIDIKNSASGELLLYAGHGEVQLQNNTTLNEVTGYRLRLKNNTQVIYKTGLASLLFTSGPGGSYVIDSWQETQ